MALESLDIIFDSSLNYRNYIPLGTPLLSRYDNLGSTGNNSYSYKLSAVSDDGETDLSDEIITYNSNAVLSSVNFVRIFWNQSDAVNYYKLYKLVNGSYLFLAKITDHFHYDDIGLSPSSITHQGYNSTGYDPSFVNLGYLMKRYTGATKYENYVSPLRMEFIFNGANYYNNTFSYIFKVIRYTKNLDYIFMTNTSNSQNIQYMVYNRKENKFYQGGVVYMFFRGATNMYIYDADANLDTSSDGNVNVSGNTVTGFGTKFDTLRFSVGSRIGFGSTNPEAITEWYEVASIVSDTSLTLTETVTKTYPNNCPYIIEELSFITAILWNTSPYNLGGVYLVKGINFTFMRHGNTVPFATTVDRVRANYRILYPGTYSVTYASNLAILPKSSNTEHIFYGMIESGNTMRIAAFNARAPLTLIAGESTSAFKYMTKSYDCINTADGLRMLWLPTGQGRNKHSIYFRSGSAAVLQRIDLDDIKQDGDFFGKDYLMVKPLANGIRSYAQTGPSNVRYIPNLEQLLFSSQFSAVLPYDSNYPYYNIEFGEVNLENSDYRMPSKEMVSHMRDSPNFNISDGLWYFVTNSYKLAILPGEADWRFASRNNARIITHSIDTSYITKFNKLLVSHPEILGTHDLGTTPEPFRVYYRTDGISDDSGSWGLLDDTFDMSFITPKDNIQFMFEFRILGRACVPNRIYGLSISYFVDDDLPSGFEWNLYDSSNANSIIGFEQTNALSSFNSFKITYYLSESDKEVFTAYSTENINGSFQYWNGLSWINGVGPNMLGIRRRFVATNYLPSTDVYAKITLV
jgi:hypothetical protein